MAEQKKRRSSDIITNNSDGRFSVWRVAGLTVIILMFIIAAAVVISGRGSGKKNGTSDSQNTANDVIYQIPADSVISMGEVSGSLAVLQSDKVVYIDESGNELASNEHSFADPVIVTSGKNLLLYDRGGEALRIEKNTAVFDEKVLSSPVICADICPNGTYAYVLNSDGGYQSHLYVYSYKGVKLFEWGSASDYVIDVKLSLSGKYIIINEFSVNNASHSSKIMCFKFGREEPVYTSEFPDTTVYGVKFISVSQTAVFSDRGIYKILKDSSQEKVREHSRNELNCSSISPSGLSVIALNLFGNEKNVEVTLFDDRIKKSYVLTFDEAITSVDSSDSTAAVACDDRVSVLNSYGTVTGNISLDEKCIGVAVAGRRIYVLTANGIRSYRTVGNQQA